MGALDIVILLLLLLFAVVGFKQGIIKELVQLVGMIAILVISFLFKDKLGELMCLWLPFFNFIGTPITGLTSLNILIYQLLGFVTIFAVLYGVYSIILKLSGLFQKVVDWTIILLIPSKIGGFLIGAVEGYIIMFILLVMIMGFPAEISQHFRKSELVNTIVYKTPFLSEAAKDVTASIKDVYELTDKVINKKLETNEANLQIIDTMLEYDIVKVKTVEKLQVLEKIKDIKGLDPIIEKHK